MEIAIEHAFRGRGKVIAICSRTQPLGSIPLKAVLRVNRPEPVTGSFSGTGSSVWSGVISSTFETARFNRLYSAGKSLCHNAYRRFGGTTFSLILKTRKSTPPVG